VKIYRVGGSVRDELLGRPVADHDYVVVGATPEAMRAGGFRAVGRDFPVFLHPRTHDEYALARTERKTGRGHRGFSFHAAPEVTLEEDLARRDLTINAMARADDGTLIDPFGGERDLREGVLRHVGPAFSEDPLRVLRVARFAARFGFRVAPETEALMRAIASSGELETLSAERVWQELAKALMEAEPSRFFVTLRRCGALGRLLPELETLFGSVPGRPDAGTRSLGAVDAAAAAGEPLPVRYTALAGNLARTPRTRERIAAELSRRVNAPMECRELAGLGARLRDRVNRAAALAPAAVLDLLLAVDALRRPERLTGLLSACALWHRAERGRRAANYPQATRLIEALGVIRSVKVPPPGAADRGGSDVARRIRSARLKALREGLKAQKS